MKAPGRAPLGPAGRSRQTSSVGSNGLTMKRKSQSESRLLKILPPAASGRASGAVDQQEAEHAAGRLDRLPRPVAEPGDVDQPQQEHAQEHDVCGRLQLQLLPSRDLVQCSTKASSRKPRRTARPRSESGGGRAACRRPASSAAASSGDRTRPARRRRPAPRASRRSACSNASPRKKVPGPAQSGSLRLFRDRASRRSPSRRKPRSTIWSSSSSTSFLRATCSGRFCGRRPTSSSVAVDPRPELLAQALFRPLAGGAQQVRKLPALGSEIRAAASRPGPAAGAWT